MSDVPSEEHHDSDPKRETDDVLVTREREAKGPQTPKKEGNKSAQRIPVQHDKADQSDLEIINILCDDILPDYRIHRGLLINWQVELSDDLTNLSTIIEEDIILSIGESHIASSKIATFLEQLWGLNDDVYNDFKIIILEILVFVISMSYNIKIELYNLDFHQFLLDKLLTIASEREHPLDDLHKATILNQVFRLVVIFFELGCDLKSFRKLMTFLHRSNSLKSAVSEHRGSDDERISPNQEQNKQNSLSVHNDLSELPSPDGRLSPFKKSHSRRSTASGYSPSSAIKLIILELLQQVFTKYPSHFKFTLFNKITSFPFTSENLKKKFTIQAWFKINSLVSDNDDPITLFILTNSNSNQDKTSLKVQVWNYSKISIEIKNHQNGSRIYFTFNQILKINHTEDDVTTTNSNPYSINNQGYVHIALTYDNYSNLSLFLDGEYSESIPCPEIHKVFSTWNKVYIGNEPTDFESDLPRITDEVLIKNLTILNTNLSHEWINLLYNLGLGYDWDFKEFTSENLHNLLNHLNPKGLFNVAMKFDKLKNRKSDKLEGGRIHRGTNGIENSFNQTKERFLNSSPQDQSNIVDKNKIVTSLSKLKQDNVLFDINEFYQGLQEQGRVKKEGTTDDSGTPAPSFIYHNSNSVHRAFYTIGGSSLLLKLIETSLDIPDPITRDCSIYKSLSLLFTILNNNWRLSKEFENINGYAILSILLTKYKQNFNSSLTLQLHSQFEESVKVFQLPGCPPTNVLNLILRSSGFDFINSYGSIIINPFTYRFLLLNFDLFHETESFEFLLYHFQILVQGSKYSQYNNAELAKMKLLKKLIQFLKAPTLYSSPLSASIQTQLGSTITSIVKSDSSVDTIKSVSLYIIFALYSPECSTEVGVTVLKSLTEIICDTNSSIKTLKKFSRSITIHWILLLFNYKNKEVVICGIKLLSQLLRILGPHIIKKFFQVNHGLDILTHFLREWWDDDKILCLLFLSSFGVEGNKERREDVRDQESLNSINSSNLVREEPQYDLVSVQKNLASNHLVLPEFLILINNLCLNSMYTLSSNQGRLLSSNPSSPRKSNIDQEYDLTLSLNVLHLLNEYIESIRIGFNNSKALHTFYLSKEFLDGIFELLGHLKLSTTWTLQLSHNFEIVTTKLIKVLSDFFIENFINDSFMPSFENLNASTRVLILDSIFPKIFEHVNQFVNVSNFIFNEKKFLESTVKMSNYYFSEFVRKNYYTNLQDLDVFITCICSLMEVEGRDGASLGSGLKKLRKELGGLIVLKFMKLGSGEQYFQIRASVRTGKPFDGRVTPDLQRTQSSSQSTPDKQATPETPSTPSTQTFPLHAHEEVSESRPFHLALKFLLYRQTTILQNDILDDKRLGELLELVLGIFLKSPKQCQSQDIEYTFNFLRTCFLMNQENFDKILSSFQLEDKANSDLLLEFFERLLTKNDDESFHKLTKYSQTIKELSRSFNRLLTKYTESTFLNVSEMLSVTLHNGGMLGNLNNIYIKSFEKDCDSLRSSIINGELIKYNRFIQDLHENVQFFISSYNVLKFETFRLLNDGAKQKNFMLDYIENNNRMRKRLIIEDQIPDSEKLSYNINVPIKELDQFDESSGFHDYDDAINSSGIDTLSLSGEGLSSVLGLSEDSQEDEGFEIIEDNPTTTYEDKNRKVIRSLFMGDQISALWNISQINGLVPVESLMILGTNHLYLIENYFHCSDGNVVDVQDVSPELRDLILHSINSQSSAILKNDGKSHRNKNWSLDKLSAISKRQFLLRDIAIEMFFNDGASILITCLTSKDRDVIYNRLHSFVSGKGLDHDLSEALQIGVTAGTGISTTGSVLSSMSGSSFSFTKLASAFSAPVSGPSSLSGSFIAATRKWKMGEMSNFYYLMIINTLAGRTFNDLTQYPVFPWVIADYTSDALDLSNPKTFRDLSKPMGAQSPHRANQFKERFDALDSLNDHDAPAFHYGTHYSSAMIVTSFLIRLKPYVQSYLLLQGGKFDHADRLFNSLQKAWNSASRDNTTDVRELTPEFFYLPEFLVNTNNFEFGLTQNGESPNNVELPPWAKNDPKIFIAKNREALESSYVSANLHLWIDLIFGYKQNGPEAEKALNVFHHLSYNGAINLDNINDEVERRAIIGMINNFGQTPQKLFYSPHPMKEVLNLPNYYLTTLSDSGENPKLIFESKLKLPIEKLEISSKNGKRWVGRPSCITSEDDLLIRKANKFKYESGSLIINQTTFLNIHSSNITAIMQIGHKSFLTGSEDGIINVWKCATKPNITLQFQSVLRGHFSPIVDLKFSKSFKIGVSLDADHTVILWDLTRLKFIRKITSPAPSANVSRATISISNDSGNIGIIYFIDGHNRLLVYTVNGELIIDQELGGGKIESFNFGSVNDTMVDTGKNSIINNHTHWSNEIFAVSIGQSLHVYELSPLGDCGWQLNCIDSVDFSTSIEGAISSFLLFNHCEIDIDDKLARGVLRLIFGDTQGKVYSI